MSDFSASFLWVVFSEIGRKVLPDVRPKKLLNDPAI